MDTQELPRKCSAVRSDGQPCQAWAIRGSRPALCSVHAGRCNGPGAPVGNKNALKHGYYTMYFTEREIGELESLMDRSLAGELALARMMLGRVLAYASGEGASTEEISKAMPLIFSGLRTVIQLLKNLDDGVDWDAVLDEVGKGWDIEI